MLSFVERVACENDKDNCRRIVIVIITSLMTRQCGGDGVRERNREKREPSSRLQAASLSISFTLFLR